MSGFWARRRAAVEQESLADARALEAAAQAEAEARLADRSDEDLLQELGLPDPDTMDADADFRAFLKDTVPQRLRTRALRRLWRVNPVLANLDGLIDYGDDYTQSAGAVETLTTVYQVGRGMLPRIEALAAEARAAALDTPVPDIADAEPETDDAPAAADAAAVPPPDEDARVLSGRADTQVQDPEPASSRRRMQFSFPAEGAS